MNSKRAWWVVLLLAALVLGVGVRSTEALSAGHYPEVNIGYTDGAHARTYTAAPNFRQGSDSLAAPKSTISNADATDLYVNFQVDTTGWAIFVVYTTDGTNPHKTNGTCVQGAFSKYNEPDRTWYVTIPASANTAGATVKYVFYANTSGGACGDGGLANANRRVASEAGGVEGTWTEGDAAYGYLVRYCSTTSGNWNTGSTWVGGAVPPSGSNIEICSGDTVTLDTDATVNSLRVNDGGTFQDDATGNTLTIADGGTLTNRGTFVAGSGTVAFAGTGSVGGAVTFQHVTLNATGEAKSVDLGSSSTINGTLTINAYRYLDTNAPIYGSSAVLKYNTGGICGRHLEWSATSGTGYPHHVQISNGTGLDLGNGGTGTARAMAGNLIVDAASGLYMDYGDNDMTAALTVGGDVTINGTLSLSELAGGDLVVRGSWSNNNTFNSRGRQVTFNGSEAQSIGGSAVTTFDYLLIDNAAAGEVTLAQDIVVRRELEIAGSSARLNAGAATMTMPGDDENGLVFINNGTFNRGTGTVVFSGENEKHARILGSAVTTFNDVTLLRNSGGSGNFGVDFYDHDTSRRAHIAGTLTLNANTFVASEEDGSSTGCVAPDPYPLLELNQELDQCDGTPIYDAGSTLHYNNGGSFDSAAEWWPNDADPTCGMDKGMPYNVVIQGGTTVNINAAFGNNSKDPNYLAGSNKTACGMVTIVSGSTLESTAGTLSVKGDWTNNGTYTHNSGRVVFNGASAQTIGGSSGTTFYDLTVDNGSGVALGQDQRVDRTLHFSAGRLTLGAYNLTLGSAAPPVGGTLDATRMVVADGAGSLCKDYAGIGLYLFPVGDATGTVEYSPVELNFTGVTEPGTACVRVVNAEHEDNAATHRLARYWPVSAAGLGPFACTATFHYVDADTDENESTLLGLKCDDGTCVAHDPVDAENNRFTISDMDSFSDFTAGGSPTAVRLASFTGRPAASGLFLAWETASEADNVGFHLYRSTRLDALGVRLNETLIPSDSPGSGQGAAYEFWDGAAIPGTTYYYTLEDVDINGRRTPHGPVTVTLWRAYLPVVRRDCCR